MPLLIFFLIILLVVAVFGGMAVTPWLFLVLVAVAVLFAAAWRGGRWY